MSPVAFSAGAAEAGSTVRVISSLAGFDGSPSGVGTASAAFEVASLEGRAVFRVGRGDGRGWKAFEIDWPSFLKKSPVGSAFVRCPLKKKSAATSKEMQRERAKRVIGL